jgi:hypothetical protein
VTAYAGLPVNTEVPKTDPAPLASEDLPEAESGKPSSTSSLWAMLIARIYEILPLVCPRCGGELKIVAFLTEADPIQRILICLAVNRPHRLESHPLAHRRTGSKRNSIKRVLMNRKMWNRYPNLSLIRP